MRVFDIVLALLGIVILSPLFVCAVVLTRASSSGPVFYSQQRVGRSGKLFRLHKFRTMIVNADQVGTSVTTGIDPRVTSFGRFLRRTKMDELPQLFNVLKGDMGFVGPRPDVPEIVYQYTPEMMRILEVRPGITSNATLHLRNEEDLLSMAKDPDKAYSEIFVPAKVRLAMEHVRKKSILFDAIILVKTAWAITGGRICPQPEHPFIAEIKAQIAKQNASARRDSS